MGKDNGLYFFPVQVTGVLYLNEQYTLFIKVTASMGLLFEVEGVKVEPVGQNVA